MKRIAHEGARRNTKKCKRSEPNSEFSSSWPFVLLRGQLFLRNLSVSIRLYLWQNLCLENHGRCR
jgi:hypothetical protein